MRSKDGSLFQLNGSWISVLFSFVNRARICSRPSAHWAAGGVFLASRSSALSQKLVAFFVIFRPRGLGAYGVIVVLRGIDRSSASQCYRARALGLGL